MRRSTQHAARSTGAMIVCALRLTDNLHFIFSTLCHLASLCPRKLAVPLDYRVGHWPLAIGERERCLIYVASRLGRLITRIGHLPKAQYC